MNAARGAALNERRNEAQRARAWWKVLLAAVCLGAFLDQAIGADVMAAKIHRWVDALTHERDEEKAVAALVSLGPDAAPYLVGELGDMRPLPSESVSIHMSGSFEGLSHYGPKVVHDAVTLVLNEITGKNFEFVYNVADPAMRARNTQQWQEWCVATYPDKARICSRSRLTRRDKL
jgi:hypothetical protein